MRQVWQPVHSASSTRETNGSISTRPCAIRAAAFEAAAEAAAQASVMSIGPWQQPARKTPDTASSTGRSLGWTSSRKLS